MPAPQRTLVVWCPDWPVAAAGYPASVPVALVTANRVVACSEAARAQGVAVGPAPPGGAGPLPVAGRGPDPGRRRPGRSSRWWRPSRRSLPGSRWSGRGWSPWPPGGHRGTSVATGPGRQGGGRGGRRPGAARRSPVPGRVWPTAASRPSWPPGLDGAGGETPSVVPPRDQRRLPGAPCPVAALDRPELADLLARLGLTTLGHLAALPAAIVLARFGTDGAVAHRLARGLDERPLAARTPPPDLAVTAELDPPAERVDMAAFVAKALADELHGASPRSGLACTRIAIEAETEHGEHLVRLWRHDGALTAGAIAERVRWQLDGWLSSGGDHRRAHPAAPDVPDEVKARSRPPARASGAASAGRRRPCRPGPGPDPGDARPRRGGHRRGRRR